MTDLPLSTPFSQVVVVVRPQLARKNLLQASESRGAGILVSKRLSLDFFDAGSSSIYTLARPKCKD